MSLISLADVKEFLHISAAGDDALLTNLISQIEKDVQNYCQRIFEVPENDYVDYYNGKGTSTVLLRNWPVISLASVYDDPERIYGSDTLIDPDDYVLYDGTDNDGEPAKIVLDGLTFSLGLQNIKVTYKAGYSTIPADLQLAVIKLVAADYLTGQGAINAVPVEGGGTVVFDRPARLRREAYQIIDRYRKMP